MKTCILEKNECLEQAADRICRLLREKPDAVLAFSAGRTMEGLFSCLARRFAEGTLSLKQARVFAVTEFEDTSPEHCTRRQFEAELIGRTDLPEGNCRFPGADSFDRYDDDIAACGGLDLAVLSLGGNAQIGFNEPAVPFSSLTHRQKLTEKTRAELAESFGGDPVPASAFTMGVKTIVSARAILVIALGGEKAAAVFQMLYARDDSVVPAAFLQIPPEVTVYADPEAAKKL